MLKHDARWMRTSARRALAYGLTLVLLTTIGGPLLAAPRPEVARAEPVRVAVGACADESKQPFGSLAAQAAAALRLAVSSSAAYEYASERDQAGRLLTCTLDQVQTKQKPRAVLVRLEAQWRDPATGKALLSTHASGRGTAPGAKGDDAMLARAALDAAAAAAVARISQVADIVGHVIETQRRGHVRVNLGRTAGIRPGTEMRVLRGGDEVCTVQARNIFPNDVDCVIVRSVQGIQAEVGDEVKVVYIPDTKEKQRRPNKSGARKFGIAVLAGLAALVAINWGGGERRGGPRVRTVINIGLSKNDIKNDGLDTVVVTAIVEDPAGTPVADGTSVIFTITTGSGKLDGADPPLTTMTAGGAGVAAVDLTTTAADGSTIVVTASVEDATTGRTVSVDSPAIAVHT